MATDQNSAGSTRAERDVVAPSSSASPPQGPRSSRERRTQSREAVDCSAIVFVVKSGSRLEGRIVDLSPSGCGIRLHEPHLRGIYTRVEVEFRLEGLPFRLGGVIQSIRDKHTLGIRFLDLGERKRSQVDELIAELQAQHESESNTAP